MTYLPLRLHVFTFFSYAFLGVEKTVFLSFPSYFSFLGIKFFCCRYGVCCAVRDITFIILEAHLRYRAICFLINCLNERKSLLTLNRTYFCSISLSSVLSRGVFSQHIRTIFISTRFRVRDIVYITGIFRWHQHFLTLNRIRVVFMSLHYTFGWGEGGVMVIVFVKPGWGCLHFP